MSDEFYIGYAAAMPPRLARGTRRAVALLAAIVSGLAIALAVAAPGSAVATFEFGRERTLEGVLLEWPYPALMLEHEPDGPAGHATLARVIWLVGAGKRGAALLVAGLDGGRARVRGSWIERDGDAMLQVETGGVTPMPGPRVDLGGLTATRTVSVAGEIVDGKCHLGVMKPGEGPVHRDCAVRCLLGGVVPLLRVRDHGTLRRVPLVDRDGRAFTGDLEGLAARPVRVAGTVVERAGVAFLATAVNRIEVGVPEAAVRISRR